MFEKIISGEKRFDVRLGDINVKRGDSLVLKESVNGKITGRTIKKKIGFYFKTKDVNYWSQEENHKALAYTSA